MGSDPSPCPNCGTPMTFSSFCGVNTCNNCGHHQGIHQCICGWRYVKPQPEEPVLPLEDDIGVAKFDGQHWDVDY